MPDASTITSFSLAALALLVVPGPAVFYIVTRSIDQGRVAGFASVFGVHCGSFVHIAAAVFGISGDGTYALVASGARDLLRRNRKVVATQRYVSGGMYVTLGIAAAFSGAKTSD